MAYRRLPSQRGSNMRRICDLVVKIQNQEDLDSAAANECDETVPRSLHIEFGSEIGTLSFNSEVPLSSISVQNSPHLYTLNFSMTTNVSHIEVHGVPLLSKVLLPRLSNPNVSLSIVDTPSLTDFITGDISGINDLKLSSSGDITILPSITSAKNVVSDTDLYMPNLEKIGSLTMEGSNSWITGHFNHLVSIKELILIGKIALYSPSQLSLNESLIFDLTTEDRSSNNPYTLDQVVTVGMDINLTSNFFSVKLPQLTSVGRDLWIKNSADCSFELNSLRRIGGDLNMRNNTALTIPLLTRLERVSNIHIRGGMNSTIGSNIFPSLLSVPGKVVIEDLNSDFDCSQLINQFNEGIINELFCNGIGHQKRARDAGLSEGGWIGVGLSIGAVASTFILVAVWVVLKFRRQLQELTRYCGAVQAQEKKKKFRRKIVASVSGLFEVEGGGIVREKSDDHCHIYELQVPPAELPSDNSS
ncbi:hypothetical protein F4808DRAFT_425180 [Astrocystis sublimbata]|nr:hypothetical protein F4808DRAFT_425180 [Astrocystis sublimbata]